MITLLRRLYTTFILNEGRVRPYIGSLVPVTSRAILEVTHLAVPKEQDQWSALGTNNSQFMSEIASDCSVLSLPIPRSIQVPGHDRLITKMLMITCVLVLKVSSILIPV